MIALDWGTSSLRAYLLDGGGRVLDSRASEKGVMHVPSGGFPMALAEVTSGWPLLPKLASGMVGSTVGWVEAPYAPCPAGAEDVAGSLRDVPEAGLRIVPGVMDPRDPPNVMRGEEVQILGALRLHPELRARACLVLPGTHSKWAVVEEGRILRFDTHMTGELFAVLREHSILGRAGGEPPSPEAALAAFDRGVAALRARGRLSPLLFSARSLAVTGRMPGGEMLDYLSGLLIAEEIAAAGSEPAALIGAPELCGRYRRALAAFGLREPLLLDAADATVAGLMEVAARAGLLREGEAA
jgi:2-dehydro-3-deoxygalactonokinase